MTTTTLRLQAECRHAVDAMWRARHRVALFEERVAPGVQALVSRAANVDQHRSDASVAIKVRTGCQALQYLYSRTYTLAY